MSPSYADFYDLKEQGHSFASMSVFEQATFNLTWGGSVERMGAARVDESFFTTLQSTPEIGRAIGAEDNQPGHNRVAMISHALWHSMFADSTDILERSLLLEGVRYKIIGVMPPAFEYPSNSDLPYGNRRKRHTSGFHLRLPQNRERSAKWETMLRSLACALGSP